MPLESIISRLKAIIPNQLIDWVRPAYHWLWAFGSALWYRFPGRKLTIIMVTGTKGKTTVVEIINTLLEGYGYRTGLASTLRFKVFDTETPNKYKMSVPGRGVLQKFMRQCVSEGCEIVVMEMTSQAVLDHRHRFIFPNALVFTNLEPEHIEAHGSYEAYREAKLQIADQIRRSPKRNKAIISNLDDEFGREFINRVGINNVIDNSFSDTNYSAPDLKNNIRFTYRDTQIESQLQGLHNLRNIMAAIRVAEWQQVPLQNMVDTLKSFSGVRGRLESVSLDSGTDDTLPDVYVDYAHTPKSLQAVYDTFPDQRKICVLGNAGGGRDTWKRSAMAQIAESHCDQIILTDEDPYDEDPMSIINEMRDAITDQTKVTTEINRRTAIALALRQAKPSDVVLVTGKGTDPFIMRGNGRREPWDDVTVVREELEKLTN